MCVFCQGISSNQFYGGSTAAQEVPQYLSAPSGASKGLQAILGWSWNAANPGQPVSLTFSFDEPRSGAIFNAEQKQNTLLAIDAFERVSAISLTEKSGTGANITFGYSQLDSTPQDGGVRGVTYLSYNSQGQININQIDILMDTHPDMGNFPPGNFGYMALMHEIGHALALKHPFDGSPTVSGVEGTLDYTFMSYSPGNQVQRHEPTGLMYNDALAMQYLYGRANHNADNSVYDFSSRTVEAIWDAGGEDVVNAQNFSTAVRIDLRTEGGPDRINTIGQSKVWFLPGSNIEHAIGGKGNDSIFGNSLNNYLYGNSGADQIRGLEGNDVIFGGQGPTDTTDGNDSLMGGSGNDLIFGNAGNDTLFGGDGINTPVDGNDTLYGGSGNDVVYGNGGFDFILGGEGQDTLYGGNNVDQFVFGWENSVDIIVDFEGANAAGGDVIRILSNINNTGISTVADVMARITYGSGHAWVNLGSSAILVAWVEDTKLGADDFRIVDPSAVFAA